MSDPAPQEEEDDDFEEIRRSFLYPSEVDEFLFVGSYRQAQNAKVLRELGITAVLCVKDSCRYPETGSALAYKHVPLCDFGKQDICGGAGGDAASELSPLQVCAAFIARNRAAKRATLVHCSQGLNRSPTVAIGVLMLARRWTLARAFAHVLERCPAASPHERYFAQLQALDMRLHGGGVPSLSREQVGPSLQQLIREEMIAVAAAAATTTKAAGASAEDTGEVGAGAATRLAGVRVGETGGIELALPTLSLPASSLPKDPRMFPLSPPAVPPTPTPIGTGLQAQSKINPACV